MNLMNMFEETPLPKECYSDSLINNLKRRKTNAESELARINEALDALQANPEVTKILIQKLQKFWN